MNSLTDLGEVVDVVIGVDTHVATHSAAAINAGTGGVLGEITVEATAEGYAQLVDFAGEHAVLRGPIHAHKSSTPKPPGRCGRF